VDTVDTAGLQLCQQALTGRLTILVFSTAGSADAAHGYCKASMIWCGEYRSAVKSTSSTRNKTPPPPPKKNTGKAQPGSGIPRVCVLSSSAQVLLLGKGRMVAAL
jgi:hypothetical protein